MQPKGHNNVRKVRQEHKHPRENDRGGRVEVPIFQRRSCDCKVRRQVTDPLSIWKHVVSRGPDHIKTQDENLSGHKEHGHGPGDPKAAKLCRSGPDAIVANLKDSASGNPCLHRNVAHAMPVYTCTHVGDSDRQARQIDRAEQQHTRIGRTHTT